MHTIASAAAIERTTAGRNAAATTVAATAARERATSWNDVGVVSVRASKGTAAGHDAAKNTPMRKMIKTREKKNMSEVGALSNQQRNGACAC